MTQEEEEIVLLDYWPSPFGTMARIALVEKGVNYIHKFEDLSNKSPLLLEMNPVHHKIPVLVHKGKSICESNIIIQYIDEIWKNNFPLLPSEPYQRAKAMFLVDFINKKVHGSSVKVWMGQNEEQENGKKELLEWSKFLEEELGDKLYFGGDVFGFVDIVLVPFYNWFIVFKTFANFNTIEIECPKSSLSSLFGIQGKLVTWLVNIETYSEFYVLMMEHVTLFEIKREDPERCGAFLIMQ
ncbi:hypothetical protein RDI58_029932 [Solanum bulbocastanum]|uniref:glutathione transferase n=1 Tax=Solanum bulbocastanum TaxID=147425 RepID=A0AAN8SSL5_SOLBU